jgi:hypothetical protein
MLLNKATNEWQKGLVKSTFEGTSHGGTAPCPCPKCCCMAYRTWSEVQSHLLARGFDANFIQGEGNGNDSDEDIHCNEDATGDSGSVKDLVSSLIRGAIHGEITGANNERPNEHAKAFFKLLKEAEKGLYPRCKEATKISFIVRLFQIKCMFGLSNSALEAIVHMFSLVLPEGHYIPDTLDKVRKVVHDLGHDYQKTDACVNDCVLFQKSYAKLSKCPTGGESRWKVTNDEEATGNASTKKRSPRKILRYFPVIPRLQRLYMMESTSSLMPYAMA